MTIKDLQELFKIKTYWTKPISFWCLIAITITVWSTIERLIFDKIRIFGKTPIYLSIDLILLLMVLFIISIFWLISTNRMPIISNSKINLYICVNIEEEFYQPKIDSIIKNAINEVKYEKAFNYINIKLLDYNYFHSSEEIEKWIKKYATIHSTIFLKFKTGNLSGDKKMDFEQISFSGFLPNKTLNLSGFKFNGINEVQMLIDGSNWEYLDKNSFNDKEKLKNNISEVILFYAGITLLYEGRIKESISIMKRIFKPEDLKIEPKTFREKIEIQLRKKTVKALQLGRILYHLNLQEAIEKSDNQKDYSLALKILIELDNFPIQLSNKSNILITKAFCYYKLGDIENSKKTTLMLQNYPEQKCVYNLNMLFLSMYTNDEKNFLKHYKQIKYGYPTTNVIHILNEYGLERSEGKINSNYLDFAEALVSICYVESEINEVISRIENLKNVHPNTELHEKLLSHLEKNLMYFKKDKGKLKIQKSNLKKNATSNKSVPLVA
jgi:hypothetical protein